MASAAYLLGLREKAKCAGDRGTYRAITADLARLGHVDIDAAPEPSADTSQQPETAASSTTTPPRGRSSRPRRSATARAT